MRFVLIVLLLASVAWAFAQSMPAGVTSATNPIPDSATCTIAGEPQGEMPKLTPAPIAELLPAQMPKLEKAYFSMGCFWGSEAMLGSCPGVIFTRVGFTGGTLQDPSYSAIGDHVETVEVLFDPQQIAYSDLLEHFWNHHNGHAKPIFRQYASAIFTVSANQEQLAKAVRSRRQATASGDPLLTAVKPLERFYPAEAAHQKYYLKGDTRLLEELPRHGDDKRETRLATKLNALTGHAGDRELLKGSLLELGLTEAQSEALFARASWPR